MKSLFQWDTVFTCLLIFATTTALYYVPMNFDFLNPLKQALGDFDITDGAQARFRDDWQNSVDTNIVLVNISTQDRAGIAHMVERISNESPRVIGIDAMFRRPKDPELDSALAQALRGCPALVLGTKIVYNERSDKFDSCEKQLEVFAQSARSTGFFNMVSDDEAAFRTVRDFSPSEVVGADTVLNFAVAVAKLYDPVKAARLLDRQQKTEAIYFHGNVNSFYSLDADQVLDDSVDISVVHDKAVLMGYIDSRLDSVPSSLEDVFFTPMNKNYAGRAFPDMYGVVIHANVLSQILHGEFINVMPFWQALILGFIMCVCTVACFNWFEERLANWYDTLTILMFLVQSLFLTFVHILIFTSLHYKLNITISLAALALTPTMHEIYHDTIKPLFWNALHTLKRKSK